MGYIKEPQFNYWDSWGVTERPEMVTGRFASAREGRTRIRKALKTALQIGTYLRKCKVLINYAFLNISSLIPIHSPSTFSSMNLQN